CAAWDDGLSGYIF
nr:immunoglobulin light chain junction region [Macaca mulatta]MPO03101.1 immunoglobulin light chain junction region [Macaca mulatta]MPO03205.1 immunoglobulin light chain junction region [Macaca mulatta]MPO03221.1 immunoglobulin light chain junction region [Macaca mulatta]MPO03247.1 immunoglobulin light chain junction region [Macaca mulatta]